MMVGFANKGPGAPGRRSRKASASPGTDVHEGRTQRRVCPVIARLGTVIVARSLSIAGLSLLTMDFAEWCLAIALTGFVGLTVVSVWIWLS